MFSICLTFGLVWLAKEQINKGQQSRTLVSGLIADATLQTGHLGGLCCEFERPAGQRAPPAINLNPNPKKKEKKNKSKSKNQNPKSERSRPLLASSSSNGSPTVGLQLIMLAEVSR